ncbi:hypothetical protein IWT25_02611 [Secundilactobacillus pentosiphilus]|uniref:Uncharacterized protein n=1 Tax=Secundilactobacillus pentosiphilus TaxID=1714682 RepID=A0A1Z5IZP9_9LACO|nr:hypothetical protein [Secundilactobacillus pentosiphilus]GAX07257.1 hypothetical protein IWT25_02611 [Secundilactobacillus pentosiphilus]
MTKLNNATQVLFASLILNGKASIDDVPDKLKEGVQAELDFFNNIEIADDNQKQATIKASTISPDTPTFTVPSVDKSKESQTQTTDQVVSDINKAVKDAK